MIALDSFSEALHIGLAAALLWILIFKLFRDYRIDALRDQLFGVRESLFDYAAGGGVAFSHPAYTQLRLLINSLIRFAHRLTFTRFAMLMFYVKLCKSEFSKQPLAEWMAAVNSLPTEPREELKKIHNRTLVLVVRHLISGLYNIEFP